MVDGSKFYSSTATTLDSCIIEVNDMMQHGKWKWPQDWYDKFPLITSIEDPTIQNDYNDIVVWISKNEEKVRFSVKTATIDSSTEVPRVCWWRLIWYAQRIPKHSFIFWLAIQNRLSTQDKMASGVWSKAKEIAEINCEESNWQELIRRLANDCMNKNIGWMYTTAVKRSTIELWKMFKYKLNGVTVKDSLNMRNVEAKWKVKETELFKLSRKTSY
ncbi:reverse transcriptase zinc-binding domain-containing protein [Artemisia annua]|uniref:Reverse transcriptase zinc-binding domain-containing protein n=1 Tax=Artemisia annua TaxID=35608 RepID=A0A2U1KX95_ARTAN|nr:reverse transcriptase zinc-binding domain-containing protein [Artemisia annua]